MKAFADFRTIGRLPAPARAAAWSGLALLGAGLAAAAFSPEFAAWCVSFSSEEFARGTIWLLWAGVAGVAGRALWRCARAQGKTRTDRAAMARMLGNGLLTLYVAGGLHVLLLIIGTGAGWWPLGVAGRLWMANEVGGASLGLSGTWPSWTDGALKVAIYGMPALWWVVLWGLGTFRPKLVWLAALGLAPVFVYLAMDESPREGHPRLVDVGPAFPGAEVSHAALHDETGMEQWCRWDSRKKDEPLVLTRMQSLKASTTGWMAYVRDNEEALVAAWTEIAPIRAWWARWSAHDQIGDTLDGLGDRKVNFRPLRHYAHGASAEALRLARAGEGDAAITVLLPVFEGAQKLEPHARTLERFVLSRVLQRIALRATDAVLDTTEVSPQLRRRLAETLGTATGGETGVRRMIGAEQAWAVMLIEGHLSGAGGLTGGELGGWLGPLVFNPNRTLNRLEPVMAEMQEQAARRDGAAVDACWARFVDSGAGRSGLKNTFSELAFTGPSTLDTTVMAYWTTEDQRAALLQRLTQDGAPEAEPVAAALNDPSTKPGLGGLTTMTGKTEAGK